MPKLGVNIDHIATIREARKVREPDPVAAAAICELAGAHGITAHLREDRRHVQERDIRLLRQTVTTHLNLEMANTPEMLQFAIDVLPDMVTLVPEKREELTTEGGLDVAARIDDITKAVNSLHKHKVEVSLFVDAELHQIKAALRTGARFIELHTGSYANAYDFGDGHDWEEELVKLDNMAQVAQKSGMLVNAGHGLNYRNVGPIAEIKGLWELNIGHAIIGRAVLVGLERAVRDMVSLIRV
ncbi:MAG TPA: pyridoxine 5'-phosphate synthase [Fibrobacteria bacterium]|nr:pyridoxine 5'-phosphate synthase [Fibrobacteria bacterium]